MPHGFEFIVRPYQSPDSLGSNVIPATPRGTRERAHLTWGGKGTMPSVRFTDVDFNTVTRKKDIVNTEKDRESDIVRIEQPGKPENYVDVARARKVNLDRNETEISPQELAERQYTASGIDRRLDPYKPNINPPPNSNVTKSTGPATWNMKNQQ
jgi:hypothetical protein